MTNHLTKVEERILLLKNIFPQSYSGNPYISNILYKKCRELGSNYCNSYDERGYNDQYESFDGDMVTIDIGKSIEDNDLLSFARENSPRLSSYTFYGENYTFLANSKTLLLESKWTEKTNEIQEVFNRFNPNGRIVLEAIYDVNTKYGMVWKNYWNVRTVADNKGFNGKGWMKILSSYQMLNVIFHDYGDLEIHKELLPLVGDILYRPK